MSKYTNKEIRERVTQTILAALEKGVSPWRKPWVAQGGDYRPHNAATGHVYRGVNVFHLAAVSMLNGYPTDQWLTFNQAKNLGGSVRKGQKSTWVIFCKPLRVRAEEGDSQRDAEGFKTIYMLRVTPVFNVAQCEGLQLSEREIAKATGVTPEADIVRDTLAFAAERGARVNLGGARAFYRRDTDEITMPHADAFHSEDGFAATLLHELTHWTGAESRLDRTKGQLFGDPEYAFEELVAELGAAMLCAARGIGSDQVESHAAYIDSWRKALQNDSQAIFRAAKFAEDAVNYLLPEQAETEQPEEAAQAA